MRLNSAVASAKAACRCSIKREISKRGICLCAARRLQSGKTPVTIIHIYIITNRNTEGGTVPNEPPTAAHAPRPGRAFGICAAVFCAALSGGNVMTSEQAAALPVYSGQDLGAVYAKRHTAFALWAPTAAAAAVHRYATGTDAEPGAADLGLTPMQLTEGGVWRATIGGDLAGQYYVYELSFPDGHTAVLVDPYARAGRGQRRARHGAGSGRRRAGKLGRRPPPRRGAGPRRRQRVGRSMSPISRPMNTAACGRNGAASSSPSRRTAPRLTLRASTRPA